MRNDNAMITEVFFGIEDHGCMTCNLMLEGEDWGCGFGGYCLDDETGAGMCAMRTLLETFGVNDIDDLRNMPVRVQWSENRNSWRSIEAIGHIVKNKWFSWQNCLNRWYEDHNRQEV